MPDDIDAEEYTLSTQNEDNVSEDEQVDGSGAEQSLLNGGATKHNRHGSDLPSTMTSLGRLRAYWLGIVVCMGGFLCALLDFIRTHWHKSIH